ncbi:MAG: hypothetical protein PHV59_04555 [Victivallales bacterium]|nr:hypothetical protein [Victivallales bacterium]
MAKEINVSCAGCNAVFSVPIEYCGETAECAECGKLFKIPVPAEKSEKKAESSGGNAPVADESAKTDTGPIKGVESKNVTDATNTVKLSRSGIGMIPEVKDDFRFSTDVRTSAPAKPKSAELLKSGNGKSPEKQVPLPEWITLDLAKNEKVIGLKEISVSAFNIPLLASGATVLSGIAGVVAVPAGKAVAIGGVLVIAGIVFAVTFLMLAKKRRQALVLTDKRAVYVSDKKTEVKI